MLKFAYIALEILLEFGMHYPYQVLAIDKCPCLFDVKLIFYEFKLLNMKFFNCFCLVVYYIYYIIHYKLYSIYNILHIIHNMHSILYIGY